MNIQLFKSVFSGREDVFAVRWENGKKSGYMPAYNYDPYLYRTHNNNCAYKMIQNHFYAYC